MYTCYHCGKRIRGEVKHVIPPLIAVRLCGDFPKAYHPACHEAAEREAGFQLAQQPATQPKRAKFESSKTTQRVLICGLDCLPNQTDLFSTDGDGH